MTTGGANTYRFGPFRLVPSERLLFRDGHVVSLTPKAFDLLVYLVEHQGRLVEKSALMAASGQTRSSRRRTSRFRSQRCGRRSAREAKVNR